MTDRAIPAAVISVLLATLAPAKAPTTRPATQPPTRPATQPATQQAVGAPEAKPRKDRDRMEAKVDGRRAIVEIHSPFGIGQGTIKLPDRNAPESLVLRLHLKGLESLRISDGMVTLSLAVASSDRHAVHQSLRRPGPAGEKNLTRKDALWVPVRRLGPDGKPGAKIPLEKGGHFEVTLPPALLKELGKDLTVHWIDFYR